VFEALTVLVHNNQIHPLRDALDALDAWDETPRLGTWLTNHFGCEGDSDYLSQVFTKWIVAMVARIYEPGVKFDWMPIFEGAQGVGKSSFGRLLAGDDHFLDWLPNLGDKDAALALQGIWAAEMGELSQFRRNEIETIKAFITRTVDKVRPPYGRKSIEMPRQCVFFGTTNRENYLTDDTGNRRFKPVKVGELDFKALKRDRSQLLAEAKFLYEKHKHEPKFLELSGNAKIIEKELHKHKVIEDESDIMAESMQSFLGKVEKNLIMFDRVKFRSFQLFERCGALELWRPTNRNFQKAAKMLKTMGAKKRMIKGYSFWSI